LSTDVFSNSYTVTPSSATLYTVTVDTCASVMRFRAEKRNITDENYTEADEDQMAVRRRRISCCSWRRW